MSALEDELLEKFRLLDKDAQKRVRALIEHEMEPQVQQEKAVMFDYDAWFREMERIREEIRANHGGAFPTIDAIGMLREIRDGEDE